MKKGLCGTGRILVWVLPLLLTPLRTLRAQSDQPMRPGDTSLLTENITAAYPLLNLPDLLKNTGDLNVDIPPDMPLRISSEVLMENILFEAQGLLSSNQYYGASHAYWQAAQLAPDSEKTLAGLSACFLLAKDYARALEAYRKLTSLYPSNEKYRLNLAAAYTGLNQPAAAAMELKKLLRLNPRHAEALYSLGVNLTLLGQPEKAATAFAACRKYQPDNPMPLVAMARMAGQRKDLKEMLRLLRLAAPRSTPREMKLWLTDPAFDPWRNNDWFIAFLASLENRVP